MKKYDDKYELTLTYLDGNTKSRRETTVIKSVGDFIDDNGVICQDIIEVKIKSLGKGSSQIITLFSSLACRPPPTLHAIRACKCRISVRSG